MSIATGHCGPWPVAMPTLSNRSRAAKVGPIGRFDPKRRRLDRGRGTNAPTLGPAITMITCLVRSCRRSSWPPGHDAMPKSAHRSTIICPVDLAGVPKH